MTTAEIIIIERKAEQVFTLMSDGYPSYIAEKLDEFNFDNEDVVGIEIVGNLGLTTESFGYTDYSYLIDLNNKTIKFSEDNFEGNIKKFINKYKK